MNSYRKGRDPRAIAVERERTEFADKRRAFYKAHREQGLVREINSAISRLEPVPIGMVLRYLAVGNERTVSLISEYETAFRRLHDPFPGDKTPYSGDYMVAIKGCPDARMVRITLPDILSGPVIEETTAAVIINTAYLFYTLREVGVGFVMTHTDCGGEKFAHEFHTGKFKGKLDAHTEPIVFGVSRGIAKFDDPHERAMSNARVQTQIAIEKLGYDRVGNPVYPIMYDWSGLPKVEEVDVLWLSNPGEHPLVRNLRSNAKTVYGIAEELGYIPKQSKLEQTAIAAVISDPYRCGRFNSPHVIFDSLPNHVFWVTEDFSQENIRNGLSPSAVGSLRYAVSHGGEGHVHGIGRENGTRHVIILDPDPEVLNGVKEALLRSCSELKELTRNGDTITLARYDLETRRVEFL